MIFLILFIIIAVYSLLCSPIQTYNITYNLNGTGFNYNSIGAYADGTILFEMISYNVANHRNLCLIYPNGTLNSIDNVKIPCDSCVYNQSYPLNPKYILITYSQSEKYMGMIMDWTGNITYNNLTFDAEIFRICVNNDRFLYTGQQSKTQLSYTEYIIDNINVNRGMSGNLTFNEINGIIKFDTFPLNDAWGIVFQADLLTENEKGSFFSVISAESKNQTQRLDLAEYDSSSCIGNKTEYQCLFTSDSKLKWFKKNSTNVLNNTDLFPFISYDRTSNITSIYDIPDIGFLVQVSSRQLKYLVLGIDINYNDSTNAFGELITNNYYGNNSPSTCLFTLPNNTIIQMIKNDSILTLSSTDLSPIIPKNNPYHNTHIKQVYPPQNDLIPINANKISITFLNPINPTTAVNITIYQYLFNQFILRQGFLCTIPYCVIEDSYSLTMNLSYAALNIPSSSYYVEIDDNFVQYKYELLTVPGIKRGNWIINTSPKYNKSVNKDNTYGTLRLNQEGTDVFARLDKQKQVTFLNKLTIEIVQSIPVDESRFKWISHDFETDKNSTLLSITYKITPPTENSFNKKDEQEIFDDLNSLITTSKDKDTIMTTSLDIATNSHTLYIDKEYGFKKTINLWEQIRVILQNLVNEPEILIPIIVCPILTIIIYLFGIYKYKEGSNIIVFKVALIIFDIVNDTIFIINIKGQVQQDLYILSMVFLIFPIAVNTFLGLVIMFFETRNPEFNEWLKDHLKPVAFITAFSLGDVELFHILDSKFGGFKVFSAPFSPLALKLMFWGRFLNIILEDMPQLIIQIFYILYVNSTDASYNTYAFFTLITSIFVLFVDIIEHGYHICINKKMIDNQVDPHDGARDVIAWHGNTLD